MPTSIHKLESEVLSLSPQDRARLLERLIDSFEPDSKIEDAGVVEALRRESEGFPYSVVYRESDTGPKVYAIAHQRREPGYWQGRVPP